MNCHIEKNFKENTAYNIMINCKIGLIARAKKQNLWLCLGEIFDKEIRKNTSILYDLHKKLRYTCAFRVILIKGEIVPDNLEEIIHIQSQYKLTRKIWSKNSVPSRTFFGSPELYDISCMIPLFSDKIERIRFPQGHIYPIRVYVLFPCADPILRGEIVDSCFEVTEKLQRTCFYTVGKIIGKNLQPSCHLSKRYLISCGVEKDNIFFGQYDDFPDCIPEILNMIKFILPDEKLEILFAVAQEQVNDFMEYIRSDQKTNDLVQKIQIICN